MKTNLVKDLALLSVFLIFMSVSAGCNSQQQPVGSASDSKQRPSRVDQATKQDNKPSMALDRLLAWDGYDDSVEELNVTQATTDSLANLATEGNAQAAFVLARMYRRGCHVDQSDARFIEYLRKAAEQGHVNAQTNLGLCYEEGAGVGKDLTEAVKWCSPRPAARVVRYRCRSDWSQIQHPRATVVSPTCPPNTIRIASTQRSFHRQRLRGLLIFGKNLACLPLADRHQIKNGPT